jgi:hypothetical protein
MAGDDEKVEYGGYELLDFHQTRMLFAGIAAGLAILTLFLVVQMIRRTGKDFWITLDANRITAEGVGIGLRELALRVDEVGGRVIQ